MGRIYEDFQEHFYQEREAEARLIRDHQNKTKQRVAVEMAAC